MIEYDRYEEVQSSMIKAIGTKGEALFVLFNNGALYRYEDAADEFYLLLQAESIGTFFHNNVRDRYSTHRVSLLDQ